MYVLQVHPPTCTPLFVSVNSYIYNFLGVKVVARSTDVPDSGMWTVITIGPNNNDKIEFTGYYNANIDKNMLYTRTCSGGLWGAWNLVSLTT